MFKFGKAFSTIGSSDKKLKEQWKIAMHDPAYLLVIGGLVLFVIIFFVMEILK